MKLFLAYYQKKEEEYLTTIFGVFERLITYNSIQLKINNYLDFSRTYGKLLENPNTRNSRELCLPENDFSKLSLRKIPQMAEKLNFMVFRALFLFEVHIQQSY